MICGPPMLGPVADDPLELIRIVASATFPSGRPPTRCLFARRASRAPGRYSRHDRAASESRGT